MAKYCPYCGTQVGETYKFCMECGKELPTPKNIGKKVPEPIETTPKKEEKVPMIKPKKDKYKFVLPKFCKNLLKKNNLIILSIVFILIIVGAAIILFYPFNATPTYGGREFLITIENTLDSNASCYLIAGGLQYGEAFVIVGYQNYSTSVIEDELSIPQRSYEIKVHTTIDGEIEFGTASAVTEYANFVIEESLIDPPPFLVNCTSFQ